MKTRAEACYTVLYKTCTVQYGAMLCMGTTSGDATLYVFEVCGRVAKLLAALRRSAAVRRGAVAICTAALQNKKVN